MHSTVAGKTAADQFLKSMETLSAGLDEKTWLILSTDSELLKYLKSSGR